MESFQTEDMTLVTYLRMRGHNPLTIEWRGEISPDVCYWLFGGSEQLVTDVAEFTAGKTRVEPRQWSRLYAKTRKEFHQSKPGRHGR